MRKRETAAGMGAIVEVVVVGGSKGIPHWVRTAWPT